MPNSKADEQPTPEETIATLRLVRREYGADMSLSGEAFVQMDLAISVLERALKAKDEEIEKAWAAAKYEAGRGADQMTRRLRAEHALASAQRRIGELSEALKEAGCHINSLHDEWSETGKIDAPFPDYIQRALATPIPETKETPAQEAVAWRVKRPRNPSWWFCETLVVAQRIVDKNPGSVIESLYLHPAPSSDDATSRLRITDEVVEIAAQAAYEVTQQKATRWHAGTQLERFVPWHEVSMDWRDDYKTTIRAALAAASGQPHE